MTGLQRALAEYHAGHLPEALAEARQALGTAGEQEKPSLTVLLANINLKLGNKKEAADSFAVAARMFPEKAAEFFKFAVSLYLGEEDCAAISRIAVDCAAANPADKELLYTLASACKRAGNLALAAPFIADLDFSQSPHFMLLSEFGAALGDAGRFNAFLREAVKTRPDSVMLLSMHFMVARGVCDFESLADFDRLVADPAEPLAAVLLENELAHMRLMRSDKEALQLLPSYDTKALQLTGGAPPAKRRIFSPSPARITIGYLSNDFCQHVTMRLFEEAMIAHDRDRFEIKLFSYTEDQKLAYQRNWPPVLRDNVTQVGHMTDGEAAIAIAEAGVDILVDLKGYTQGARLGIVRRSDAPVKATYLGYPGSVFEADLDYAITDAVVTPDSSKPFYAEKLCRLPESYQANGSRNRIRPENLSRAELGLPEEPIILGSFNNPAKMAPAVIGLWAEIMQRLPDAILNMLCKGETARNNIRSAFRVAGGDPQRIIFFDNEAYPRFLARIAAVDLVLDSMPYNGHTTTSDVLWAGTPMVTRVGHHFASRVSESLLKAMTMPELIAEDDAGYCDLAVTLANDLDRCADIRRRLREARVITPLFDTERFARHLEYAYEMMAARARQGLAADHIDVEPLPARGAAFLTA